VVWDHKELIKHWARVSTFLHWSGEPADGGRDEALRNGAAIFLICGTVGRCPARGFSLEVGRLWDRYLPSERGTASRRSTPCLKSSATPRPSSTSINWSYLMFLQRSCVRSSQIFKIEKKKTRSGISSLAEKQRPFPSAPKSRPKSKNVLTLLDFGLKETHGAHGGPNPSPTRHL
jgi:hypothetical protein